MPVLTASLCKWYSFVIPLNLRHWGSLLLALYTSWPSTFALCACGVVFHGRSTPNHLAIPRASRLGGASVLAVSVMFAFTVVSVVWSMDVSIPDLCRVVGLPGGPFVWPVAGLIRWCFYLMWLFDLDPGRAMVTCNLYGVMERIINRDVLRQLGPGLRHHLALQRWWIWTSMPTVNDDFHHAAW
ncbi:hypothetical protein BU15DRAFT_68612 [Melanogaster broomeanus]|nr:hypothetical protein BU15DRAFT_68612 [Melanogaster broomeanus]